MRINKSETATKWVIAASYTVWFCSLSAVTILSLQPGVELPVHFWNADKAGHFLAYLWLALLPALIVKNLPRKIILSMILILLGIVLEFGQMYIPGRMFSPADMGANTAGVFLGFCAGTFCRMKYNKPFNR